MTRFTWGGGREAAPSKKSTPDRRSYFRRPQHRGRSCWDESFRSLIRPGAAIKNTQKGFKIAGLPVFSSGSGQNVTLAGVFEKQTQQSQWLVDSRCGHRSGPDALGQ